MEETKALRWGDEEEIISNIQFPSTFTTQPDSNGVKTVTEYWINVQGQKVKTVKKVKTSVKEVRKHRMVAERRNWAKFGDAKNAGPGPENGITKVADVMELILQPKLKVDNKPSRDALSNLGKGSSIVCRLCLKVGSHWTKDCPYKNNPEELKKINPAAVDLRDESTPPTEGLASTPGKYVPPGLRGAGGARIRDLRSGEDEATVRVSNLPAETRENDVRELFSRFGQIHRLFLSRDKNTGESKGFAYVNFARREDAALAIEKLNGHGYGYLVLSVEWAKPSTR